MTTKIHNPAGRPAPATYSHGIEVSGAVRTVYVAGQVAIDTAGKTPAGIADQTRLAFANLLDVLKASGMQYENIVKTTVFLVEPGDYAEFAKIRSEILGTTKPASTLVFIKQLVTKELLVEVEAIAVGS